MKFQIQPGTMQKLEAELRKLPKQFRDASAVGQFNAAQDVMAVSKTRAPFEHGDLEKAAFVDPVKYTAQSVVIGMGYAGVPYMVRQHEDLSYNHPGLDSKTADPGRASQGQPKFLESAVNDGARDTERTIREAIDYFLRTGSLPKTRGSIGPRR